MAASFTITNVSISRDIFDLNDVITISYKINNTGTVKMTNYSASLRYKDGSQYIQVADIEMGTAINTSASKTASVTLNLEETVSMDIVNSIFDGSVRHVDAYLQITANFNGNLSVKQVELGDIINRRDGFKIDRITARRCNAQGAAFDEGTYVSITAYTSTDSHGIGHRALPNSSFSLKDSAKVYYAQERAATTSDSYISIPAYDPTTSPYGYNGRYFSHIISDTVTFNIGYDYGLLFMIGDEYDSDSKQLEIYKAFANVHLSGTGEGVAFGKFSSSTVGNPLFECEYPAEFSDDVDVDGNVSVGGTASITGNTSFGGNVAVGSGKLLKVVDVALSVSVASGDNTKSVSKTAAQVQTAIGTGWTALCCIPAKTGSYLWYFTHTELNSGALEVSISRRSAATGAGTVNPHVRIICIRTSL